MSAIYPNIFYLLCYAELEVKRSLSQVTQGKRPSTTSRDRQPRTFRALFQFPSANLAQGAV